MVVVDSRQSPCLCFSGHCCDEGILAFIFHSIQSVLCYGDLAVGPPCICLAVLHPARLLSLPHATSDSGHRSPVWSFCLRSLTCRDHEASRVPGHHCFRSPLIQVPPPEFFTLARPHQVPPAACGEVRHEDESVRTEASRGCLTTHTGKKGKNVLSPNVTADH